MFALQDDGQPVWMDVAEGISILLKPAHTETLNAARRQMQTAMRAEDGSDREFAFVQGALIWGALDWRGIGDATGSGPLAMTADGLTRLLRQRPDIYRRIDADYIGPVFDMAAEKKGSSLSLTGGSGATGTATARPAPASAKRARSRSTPPKPTRATGSGASSTPAPSRSAPD